MEDFGGDSVDDASERTDDDVEYCFMGEGVEDFDEVAGDVTTEEFRADGISDGGVVDDLWM